MENDILNTLWNNQNELDPMDPNRLISKAKNQRRRQIAAIIIMSVTVVILVAYTLYISPNRWNNFTLGLLLMITSLGFRVFLEIRSIYQKQNRLVALDHNSYKSYLKKYYKLRLLINYLITPVCVVAYLIGFFLLLPYFKVEFSEGFYTYILISGFVSLAFIIIIIIHSIIKESRFLKLLKQP
ncbi:hypothetical protein [Winogradskyella tangerina]|uniref:hypothetical protein n=1 Tax=Winogradskyella tangerina TaxID=2023240 RepID=UPI000DBE7544|nr:hypothetical protein [Winogradskyella tangerina]